jgi:heme A synthase
VLPREPELETMIEFGHRLTSGLAGILVIILLIWAYRAYPKGHAVRLGAMLSFVFIITEGLIGAGLVLFELVAHNASLGRVFAISAHLVNTFILIGVLVLTAWWASGGKPIQWRTGGYFRWLLGLGLLAIILLGVTGAITALGDTLFPDASLQAGLQADFDPAVSFLKRLRVVHPLFAMLTGLYMVFLGSLFRAQSYSPATRKLAAGLIGLFFVQLAAGLINVILLAPVWMQLIHLLLADLVWLTLVLLAATVMAEASVTVDARDNIQAAAV